MPDADDILALYEWSPGSCFRCARRDVPTTRVDELTPRSGETVELRACERCVLALEEQKRRCAERRGEKYAPGRLSTQRQ